MTKILMIDDHPTQIQGYKTILSYNKRNLQLEITEAYDCKSAYEIIEKTKDAYDLAFIDRSLPPYKEKKIYSGEDLAKLIKSRFPTTKIVILTSHSEAFLLYNIVKNIAPEGLLVKSDFSADELLVAFDKIMDGETYHTETVKEGMRDLLSKEEYLDSINRQIIILLSEGNKTKNLCEILNLSQSAIEKRKALIKDYLGIDKGTDLDIINEAKRKGFI